MKTLAGLWIDHREVTLRPERITNHCVRPTKARFKAIRIVDIDVGLTQPSQEGAGFRRLYLKLSGEPPPEWVKIFEQGHRFPPHRRIWRNAWVLGRHIVVECVPEELEQSQLNHLKQDVAKANRRFSECAATKEVEIRQALQERSELRKKLEDLRARLRFD